MLKISGLKIPENFFYAINSSESVFSSKPGPCIDPQRLINGQRDFYINQDETINVRPKTLILNHWQVCLWLPVLEKMSAAGFTIVYPIGDEFKSFDDGNDIELYNLSGNSSWHHPHPKTLQEDYCHKYEVSADQVMVVDKDNWNAFLQGQDKDSVMLSLEMIKSWDLNHELAEYLLKQFSSGNVVSQSEISSNMLSCKNRLVEKFKNIVVKVDPKTVIANRWENIKCTENTLDIDDSSVPNHLLAGVEKISIYKKFDENVLLDLIKQTHKIKKLYFTSIGYNDYASFVSKGYSVPKTLYNSILSDISSKKQSEEKDLPDDLNFTELEVIDLKGYTHSPNVIRFIKQAKKLRTLALSQCNLISLPDDLALSELGELILNRCSITACDLGKLVKQATKLKTLNLIYCNNLLTGSLPTGLNFPELVTLDLSGSCILITFLEKLIEQAPKLRFLDLSLCELKEDLPADLKLFELETLFLEDSCITVNNLAKLIKQATKLKLLSLRYCIILSLTDKLPDDLVFVELESLNLSSSTINCENLHKIIQKAPKLKTLNLSGCSGLDGNLLAGLNLPELEELLANPSITFKNLYAIIQRTPKLKTLGLSFCDALDVLDDELLAGLKLSELEKLDLTASSITFKNLYVIIQQAHKLKTLNLNSCHKLDGNLLADLNLSELEILSISEIHISEDKLTELIKKTPNLREITLFDCPNISYSYLSKLQIEKPAIKIYYNCTLPTDRKTTARESKEDASSASDLSTLSEKRLQDTLKEPTNGTSSKENNAADTNTVAQKSKQNKEDKKEESKEDKESKKAPDSLENNATNVSKDVRPNVPPQRSKKVDASPKSHGGDYKIKNIFFTRQGLQPSEMYRTKIFNHLEINTNPCDASEAFTISSPEDLELKETGFLLSNIDVFSVLPADSNLSHHYYGKCTLALTDEWQALPSVSPEERITHVHLSKTDAKVDIKYSMRDNLYYIKSKNGKKETVDLDFNICIPNLIRGGLPKEISSKADEFRSFSSNPLVLTPNKSRNGNDYLQALIEQKTGACRHRAVAFKAWMDKHHKDIACRIVENGCHAYIEALVDNHWNTLDLGGTPCNLEVDNSNQPIIVDPEIKRTIDITFSLNQKTNESLQVLHALTTAHGSNQLLEVSNQDALYATALALQSIAKKKNQPVFRVDSPNDLICSSHYIKRDGNKGIIKEGPGGGLYDFLTTHTDKSNPPLIIVNYSTFTASDIVRFNQLIDEKDRFIDGVPVTEKTVVVGLIDPNNPKSYQGEDFYSRMVVTKLDAIDTIKSTASIEEKKQDNNEYKTNDIELFNSNQCRSLLLGNWSLDETGLVFKPGAFVQACKQGSSKFVFHNAPHSNPEFTAFIEQIRLLGEFNCEGERITIPEGLSVNYREGFNWQALRSSYILSNHPSDKDDVVLNSQRVSAFLGLFECNNQKKALIQKPGLIEQYKGKILPIYLTHEINEQAWMRLLSHAQTHQVTLKVKLADGVALPDVFEQKQIPVNVSSLSELHFKKINHTQVIVSQHLDSMVTSLNRSECKGTVIDISEVDVSQLLINMNGQFNKEKMSFEFTEQQGALLQALANNETVILIGDFKPALIESLAPLLMKRCNAEKAQGQLILVTRNQDDFRFVPSTNQSKHVLEEKMPRDSHGIAISEAKQAYNRAFPEGGDPWVGLEKLPMEAIEIDNLDLTDSKKKTEKFFENRLNQINTLLKHSPFAFLSGLTGSGKSTFIFTQWKKEHPACYFEKAALADWAQDTSDGIKTLFIDEANISPSEYTQFEGLFNDPPVILIDNKLYPLTKNHKVIFAGNPVNYGDERHLASFFKRHGGSILFKALPPYVLYEQIIRPIFQSSEYKETEIETIAKPLLAMQQFANRTARKIIISPRELASMALLTKVYLKKHPTANAEMVAQYYGHHITSLNLPGSLQASFKQKFPMPKALEREQLHCDKEEKFVFTQTREQLSHCVNDFLALRAHRRSLNAADELELYGGLGGFLVEGEPGIGKSELIIRQLASQGIKKGNLQADNTDVECFYHIPASMGYKSKETLLLKAFQEGNVVIIDEINSCPTMERLINSLMTGYTLEGKRPTKPGFLLIGTQNPSYMAGRRKQSEAVNRRMLQYHLPPYSDAEMKAILKARGGLSELVIDYLIKRYHACRDFAKENDKPLPCFRDLIKFVVKQSKAQERAMCSSALRLAAYIRMQLKDILLRPSVDVENKQVNIKNASNNTFFNSTPRTNMTLDKVSKVSSPFSTISIFSSKDPMDIGFIIRMLTRLPKHSAKELESYLRTIDSEMLAKVINAPGSDTGMTALDRAVRNEDLGKFQVLLKYGANLKQQGNLFLQDCHAQRRMMSNSC